MYDLLALYIKELERRKKHDNPKQIETNQRYFDQS